MYYEEGYRKAGEVRKETIREVVDYIDNTILNDTPEYSETDSGIRTYHYLTVWELLDMIKEKFGTEVEE